MNRAVIIILISITALGVIACGGGLFLVAILFPVDNVAVETFDRSMVLTSDDFSAHLEFPGDRDLCESDTQSHYSDGERYYKYTFDATDDPNTSTIFLFMAHTNVCVVESAAIKEYDTRIQDAYLLASMTEANRLDVREDLLSLGDACFVAFILNEFGDKDGMAVVVRSGNTVISFRLIGSVLEDASVLTEILEARLEVLQS